LSGIGCEQDSKLIPAQPRDLQGARHHRSKPARNLAQEPVSDSMSVGIVHGLEAVEVEKEQSTGGPTRPSALESFRQCLGEPKAVGKPGQRVKTRGVECVVFRTLSACRLARESRISAGTTEANSGQSVSRSPRSLLHRSEDCECW
jgi:hypothetical protein